MMDLARELMPRALAVALSFSRGAGFVSVSPFPGNQAGPKARVGLAVMLAWVAGSLSPVNAELTTLDARAISSVASEVGIGLMIGMAFRFVLSAGEILGQNLSQATVLSTPAGFNPMLSTTLPLHTAHFPFTFSTPSTSFFLSVH
jgi:flagellar biosynthesis protein FliR